MKSKHKLQGIDSDYDYSEWQELTKPSAEELEAQRKAVFPYMPKFSIVIPVYKTPEKYLKEMLDSILSQTYGNWELCIADGSPKGESLERMLLKAYAEEGLRIRYKSWEKTWASPETPTRPWRWQGGFSSSWRIMTIS